MRTPRFLLWIIRLLLLIILSTACASQKKLTVGATATLLEDIAKNDLPKSLKLPSTIIDNKIVQRKVSQAF